MQTEGQENEGERREVPAAGRELETTGTQVVAEVEEAGVQASVVSVEREVQATVKCKAARIQTSRRGRGVAVQAGVASAEAGVQVGGGASSTEQAEPGARPRRRGIDTWTTMRGWRHASWEAALNLRGERVVRRESGDNPRMDGLPPSRSPRWERVVVAFTTSTDIPIPSSASFLSRIWNEAFLGHNWVAAYRFVP